MGSASANLQATAEIWSAIFGGKVTAEQVCLCMAGFKLARLAVRIDDRDSQVDA